MPKKDKKETNNKIILYYTEDGETEIEVNLENETVWLSQKQMAELFDCSTDNISLHLKNVYFEGELDENRTSKESSVVQTDRIEETLKPHLEAYNK